MRIKFNKDFTALDIEGTKINTKEELLEFIKNNQEKPDFVCENYRDLVEFEQWTIDITYAEPIEYTRITKKNVEKSLKLLIQTIKFPDLEFIKSLYSKSIEELKELSFIQFENPSPEVLGEYNYIDHYFVIKHLEENLDLETSLNEYCKSMIIDLNNYLPPIETIILPDGTNYKDILYENKDFTIDTLVLVDFSSKINTTIEINEDICIHYVFKKDWNSNSPSVNYYTRRYIERDYSMFYTIRIKPDAK